MVRTLPQQTETLTQASRVLQLAYKMLVLFPHLPSERRYHVRICEARKFIWFRVPKVASLTIAKCLEQSGVPLAYAKNLAVHYPPAKYRDYFKFAFVRNPWDRLVSCWLDRVCRLNYFNFDGDTWEIMRSDFGVFCDYVSRLDLENCNSHLRMQSVLLDLNNLDYLGRFENFDADLRQIFPRLEIEDGWIPKENASPEKKSYRHYYSDALAEKIGVLYQKDVQVFNYTF